MPPDEIATDLSSLQRDYALLPAELQREAADFVSFLRQRYATAKPEKSVAKKDFTEESFVGMWRDREDMDDSTEYVRQLRQRNWTR